jgi:hypothetical protein
MGDDVIKIERLHGYYRVSGDLPSKIPWSRIRGYKWYGDGGVKYHLIPVKKKRDLWAMLKIHAAGMKAIGPKGEFTIESYDSRERK